MSGSEMDYETFKAEYDSIPQLKNIVQQFDSRGVTLVKPKNPEATRSDKNTAGLDAAASRAASKSLKQPG